MAPDEIEIDKYLKDLLDRLHPTHPLDPQLVAQEREKYLVQGKMFRSAVSQQTSHRHIGWINKLIPFNRSERFPMLSTPMVLVVILAIFMMLFGGAGTAVSASQDSLPGEHLYPLKIWSEDVRLSLTNTPQEKLALVLDYTDRRVKEVASLQATGKPITETLANRFDYELKTTLTLAAGMDKPQMMQALVQIRLRAENQSGIMEALMNRGSDQADLMLVRIQNRLQEQIRLVKDGESDPQGFRQQNRDRVRDRSNNPSQTPQSIQPSNTPRRPSITPKPTGNSYGPGPGGGQATGTPGHYGPGEPNPSSTLSPKGGKYGPGPGQPTETPSGNEPNPRGGIATRTPTNDGVRSVPLNPTATPRRSGNFVGALPTPSLVQGGGRP